MNTAGSINNRASEPEGMEMREERHSQEGIGKESALYLARFNREEDKTRSETWKILCQDFFQQFISPDMTVVDLGAGDGNFITNIRAGRRIAVDISEHVRGLEKKGVEVIVAPAGELSKLLPEQADVLFMSNFLEHLPSKRVLLDVLAECHHVLKPGGRVMILQPNIRYVKAAYWDYVDHHIALTEHSLVEALTITGFSIQRVIPRFLPYTVKSAAGSLVSGGDRSWLIRLYLRVPLLWRIFGQQTFVIAKKGE